MPCPLTWLDERTGLSAAWKSWAERPVPARSYGLHLWPSTILFTFIIEAITGLVLWMFYSPSAQTAWESVYYLQYEVMGGALLRSIHYHAGQVLLGLVGLYVVHMILVGAYRARREVVFWIAVLMGCVTLALLLTGDVLAWTQRGYWSTNVRTNFLLLLPGVGSSLYKLAVGGPGMGHLTLTRFFALHAGLFSVAFGLLIWLHGRTARRADEANSAEQLERLQECLPYGGRPARWWPDQVLPNAIACMAVLGVIGAMVCTGVELGAPRDPADAYAAARPDWYFVGLYQFASYFPGSMKIVPIFVIPGALVAAFLLMPLIGRWLFGHVLNILGMFALGIALAVLSVLSLGHDRDNPSHQASLAAEQQDAVRVRELIDEKGIPAAGALALLRDDPQTQGPKLFKQHCASCHDLADPEGRGILAEKPSAPNLYGFASQDWLRGFFDIKQLALNVEPEQLSPTNRPRYFGNTAFKKGKMVKYLKEDFKTYKKEIVDGDEIKDGEKAFQELLALLAAEKDRKPGSQQVQKPSEKAMQLFEGFGCTGSGCHSYHGAGKVGDTVDLTGYGSKQWLAGIIADPTHKRFYSKSNDRMPCYAPSGAPDKAILTPRQLEMLVEWLSP